MGRKTRRFILGASVVAALVASAPGTAVADTNCGLLVCAEAESDARWTCGHDGSYFEYWIVNCSSVAIGEASGSSDLSVPGSLNWGASASCVAFSGESVFSCGAWGLGPDVIEGVQECTWAGLGEDSCGGSVVGVYHVPIFLEAGTCVSETLQAMQIDFVAHATVGAIASKSLPVAGQVDSTTAFSSSSAALSEVPDDVTTCAPPA